MAIEQPPAEEKKPKKHFWEAWILSLIIHITFLFMVGGAVIIQSVIPKTAFMAPLETVLPDEFTEPMQEESEELPLELPLDKATPEALSVAPAETAAPEIIFTEMTNPLQSVTVPRAAVNSSMIGQGETSSAKTGALATPGKHGAPRTMTNLFGSSGEATDGLVGYFYDLKQTPDRKPFPQPYAPPLFTKVVSEFIQKGWDPAVLEPYYKVKKPMTSYQFCIPQMNAAEAPKAFGVERDVQPRGILVHYRGTIIAPKSGSFRFVGNGDDILFVRFNKKDVLNTSSVWATASPLSENLKGKVPLAAGTWFQMSEGQSYPMEVLIGEQPGGLFHAFLLIQERSEKPEIDPSTQLPILRVFQTTLTKLPKFPLFPTAQRNPRIAEEPFVCAEFK